MSLQANLALLGLRSLTGIEERTLIDVLSAARDQLSETIGDLESNPVLDVGQAMERAMRTRDEIAGKIERILAPPKGKDLTWGAAAQHRRS